MKRKNKILALFLPVLVLIGAFFTSGITALADSGSSEYIDVSLTVGDNIVTNYYVDYQQYMAQGADTLYYSYNSSSEEEAYTKYEKTVDLNNIAGDVTVSGGKIAFSVPQAAAQLDENVVIRLYNSATDNTVCNLTYSAKKYCDSVINMDSSALSRYTQGRGATRLKMLCKSIIAYSKATQGIFTDYMLNDGAVAITDDYSSDLSLDSASYDSDYDKTKDNTPGENISFRTASFVCTSAAKMRFYFNVNDESDTTNYGSPVVSGPGSSCEKGYTLKDGKKDYFLQINDIKPVDFDEKITVNYAGASIKMSVLDYAARIIEMSNDSSLKSLAKTLIVYNEKADDYFDAEIHNMNHIASKETTCLEAGNEEYYYCTDCNKYFTDSEGENETTLEAVTIPALGHSYATQVTAPTCNEQGYTTYTCTSCGDTYKSDYTDALGHNFVASGTVAPTHEADGYTTYTCSRCDELKTDDIVPALNIKVKLPNVDEYLYRAGNLNNITLGTLFEVEDVNKNTVDSSKVTLTVTNVAGNAAGTFTANASDWTAATVKFSGVGAVTLSLKQAGVEAATLNLEIVAGTNYAEGATLGNVTSNNAVLLGNVVTKTGAAATTSIGSAKTLYGNGFSVTDKMGASTSNNTNGYITINGGGSIDNAVMLGKELDTQVTSGIENEGYAPGIRITGDANIYNSYVSGRKNAIQVEGGDVNIVNTTIDGGALSNLNISAGNVTLENCVTTRSTRGTKTGLAVWISSASGAHVTLDGSFTQYNLIKQDEIPSDYRSFLSGVYNDSGYYYTIDGTKYVNMGVMCLSTTTSVPTAVAQTLITDNRSASEKAKYGYYEQGASGVRGTAYTVKSSNNASLVNTPEYVSAGQYYTQPTFAFDYTTKNYEANTGGSSYCYYDSSSETVNISFEAGSSKTWDTMILTSNKLGNALSYTVSMNGTDYTNRSITFTENGNYTVEYTVSDPYNYDKDLNAFNHSYVKTVNISVVTVDAEEQTYPAKFTYPDSWGDGTENSAATTIINNVTYVYPTKTGDTTNITTVTVGGQSLPCVVVPVAPTNSSGGTYSSGKGYYFSPAFKAINITDYNQETGAQQYTYNSSTQTWPHGIAKANGPDGVTYGYPGNDKSYAADRPFATSQNATDYGYNYVQNAGGLVFAVNGLEKDKTNVGSKTVKFKYKSNEGTEYYYYIKYVYSDLTYKSCVAEGSLVTMADGTKKPVEDVNVGDMVMTWSMWNGRYEAMPVGVKWYHGTENWEVMTLKFSDGTKVRMIGEHGFFDVDKNTYAYIRSDNVEDYIGDRFIKQNAEGANAEVTLDSYEITEEYIGSYSLQSVRNDNFIVEDMLSITAEDEYPGKFEFFEIGENMKYDEEKMQADIERYGLFTYDEFSDYLTEEQFNALNGPYYKILVGKGVLTREDIIKIIEKNLN